MATAVGPFLEEMVGPDGYVQAERLISTLRISRGELAFATGLSRQAVSRSTSLKTLHTQSRLRDVVEIVNRVLPWCGSVQQAFAWYRAQPLPSFGDRTAEDLVKDGQAEAVKRYLSRIAVGGYA